MTPDEEAQFIELWKAGAPYLHIAEMMKIPTGTVGTRARALQQRGLIQARARGGYKRRPARRDTDSPQVPAAPAPHAPAPPAPPRKAKKIDGFFPNLLCRKFNHF